MPPVAWILLLLLSLLWGGSYLSARVAAPEIAPFTLVFLRVVIAAALLGLVLRLSGSRLGLTRRSAADFAVMGLLNNVIPFALIFYGTSQIEAGLASILNAATPMMTVLVFHVFTEEKLKPLKVAGVIIGFAGVAVMMGGSALGDLGGDFLAELACIGATISYAFSSLWARRFKGQPPLRTATGQLTASSLLVLPLMLIFEAPWAAPAPSGPAWAAVIFLALAATALAYVVFFRIITLAGASSVMLVTFLVPVSAVLLGWLVLGEVLEPRHWVGMALIMAGLAAIDGRVARMWMR
ncbi:DMT family transporter [Methylobrevis pamukkalensis]|uniref:Putative inner membrane transporter YedA n=1 Tax=Methylobrevis pamukkalensis TaxID=1439726 RepID=A0A1E3GX06_9HYPH|nr:DMT family transporter [Methylobrevis pamukkalensis]ODN68570.1 putative inner membrane transporter YedA [Methylobrevis pamukkalensis]